MHSMPCGGVVRRAGILGQFRPTEVETLVVTTLWYDPSKAKLGWTPKTSFVELVAEMVREDLKGAQKDELVKRHGFATFERHE